jgi:gliding motility-associated lipoprotein GldH
MKKIGIFLILFLVLFSCQQDEIPVGAFSFHENKWEQKVKPTFELELSDTTNVYDFFITLRTTTDYKYSNLFIYVEEIPPFGPSFRTRHEIPIANPDGSWIGEKTGTIIENKFLVKRAKVPFIGKYKFIIEQAITDQEVSDVLDISFQVKKFGE